MAILFKKLFAETENSRNKIAQEIEEDWLSRIKLNLPAKFYNSPINNKLFLSSPLIIFDIITSQINLNQLITNEDIVYLETPELVSICTEWVTKLKEGL